MTVMHAAPAAARLAGITYRRLDYWHRQGWIVATETRGRHRRYYDDATIVMLAALGHLTDAGGLDVATFAPKLNRVSLFPGQVLAVNAPVDALIVVDTPALVGVVTLPGRWVVFDPTPTLRRLLCAEHEATA